MSLASLWRCSPCMLALVWIGCSDDAQVPARDAGSSDARTDGGGKDGRQPDLGGDLRVPDGLVADGPTGDQGGVPCNAGLNVAPLTLASGYCVGVRVALPESLALAFDGSTLWTAEHGTSVRRFVLRARSLDYVTGTLGLALDIFDFEVAGSAPLFGGQYLAAWPALGHLAFGYTLDDQNGALWTGGGGATPMELAAKGNYDATYLDADTLLVNGLGAGAADDGPGTYVFVAGAGRRLIKDVGAYSGPLARGDNLVFVGGFTTQNELWAFTRSELKAAIAGSTTLSGAADGDLVYAGPAIDAAALGDDLLVLDDDFVAFNGLRRLAMTVVGDKVTKGTVSDVLTPGTDKSVKPSELVVHDGWIGLRLTGGASDELVLLRAE